MTAPCALDLVGLYLYCDNVVCISYMSMGLSLPIRDRTLEGAGGGGGGGGELLRILPYIPGYPNIINVG